MDSKTGVYVLFAIALIYFFSLPLTTVSVSDYVCSTCSVSTAWQSSEQFNEKIMFDYGIEYSKSGSDAVLNIIDSTGTLKEIYRGSHVNTCDVSPRANQLIIYNYPSETWVFSVENDVGTLETIDGDIIKTISLVSLVEPYNLHVVVKSSRGIRCDNSGITYEHGIVNINNIAVQDTKSVADKITDIFNDDSDNTANPSTVDASTSTITRSFKSVLATINDFIKGLFV